MAADTNQYLPMELLVIPTGKDGIKNMVPAFSIGWVEERPFLHFKTPPCQSSKEECVIGARECWLETVAFYNEDLEWLLSLKQHKFWSQVIYYKKTMPMVVSFLQEAVPFYLIDSMDFDSTVWEAYQKTYSLIFAILLRLITHKESEEEYMSSEFLGNIIYENYIFTISVIFDLCVLYGKDNPNEVHNIILSVFKLQPHYNEDLRKSVEFCSSVLQFTESKFGAPVKVGEPIKLSEKNKEQSMSLCAFKDLVLHILDTTVSLSMFLDIYSPACSEFHNQLFETRLMTFYEYTIPEMYKKLDILVKKNESEIQFEEIKEKLNIIRLEILKSFRFILYSCINDIMENKDLLSETEVKKKIDDYLAVLTESASEKIFTRDYHSYYQLDSDLEIIMQLCPDLDTFKCDFLKEAVLSCFDLPQSKRHQEIQHETHMPKTSNNERMLEETNENDQTRRKRTVGGVELESLITEVKDLLPHLGEGFIEKCLDYYDFSSASVINACLEDQLPDNLKQMDQSFPRIPAEQNSLVNGIERLNVFDGDEFDIMTQDVMDTSRIHTGKRKSKYKDANAMLDDKEHIKSNRDTYSKLGLVEENSSSFLDEYDDDYDDSYYHLDVAVVEVGDHERRQFVVPRVLRLNDDAKSSEIDEETDEEQETSGPVADEFVPNPEALRAKAEQKHQMNLLMKSGHGQGHKNAQRSKDVVGNSKGQGQEKQVTINRQYKESHKSSKSNHNRRYGAQKKRHQGMVPS